MLIERIVVSEFGTNCYLVAAAEGEEAVVIDPGANAREILQVIEQKKLRVSKIINTHGHCDHTGANREIKEQTGAQILIHRLGAPLLTDPVANLSSFFSSPIVLPPADILLEEGNVVRVGGLSLKVLFTPGHSPGGISLLVPGKAVFVGDTLFQGSIGRADFPGASLELLLESIYQKLLVLGEETVVYPGHGEITTVGQERRENPFLKER
ncbi:MAG: MBL fold metallo-hydrolase [Candidatus Latescibacteria bacterium]|nr:MBL fold metallo-hydrolase [Candidatus Latescibacterota bacterium]